MMHILKKLLFVGLFLISLQPLGAANYTQPVQVKLNDETIITVPAELYNWWEPITNMIEDVEGMGDVEYPIPNMNHAEYKLITRYMDPILGNYNLQNGAQKATAQKILQAHLEKDLHDQSLSLQDIVRLIGLNNYLNCAFMLDAAIDALANHFSLKDIPYIHSQLPPELVVMIVNAMEKSPSFDWLELQHMELQHIFPEQDHVNCVAFSSDDAQLAVGSQDGKVTIWDTQTGQEIDNFLSDSAPFAEIPWMEWTIDSLSVDGHEHRIHQIAWSPNKKFLAYSVGSCTVSVWNMETEACINLNVSTPNQTSDDLQWDSLAWRADNTYLIAAREDGIIAIWDFRDLENISLITTFSQDEAFYAQVHANEDYTSQTIITLNQNNILATLNSERGTLKLFDLSNMSSISIVRLIQSSAEQHDAMDANYPGMHWSPDGTMLAVVTNNGVIILKDIFTDEFSSSILSPSHVITSLSWAPNSKRIIKRIIIGRDDGTVDIWDAINKYLISTPVISGATPQSSGKIQWSPQGTFLAHAINEHITLFSLDPNWRSTMPQDILLEQAWLIKMAYQAYLHKTQCVLSYEFCIMFYASLPQKIQAILAPYVRFLPKKAQPATRALESPAADDAPPAKRTKIESPTHP